MNDTCRDTIASLDDYLEHALSPDHRAVVEGHLRRCPYCRDYLQTYRDTIQLCQAVADPADRPGAGEPSDALDEPARHLVEAILRRRPRPS